MGHGTKTTPEPLTNPDRSIPVGVPHEVQVPVPEPVQQAKGIPEAVQVALQTAALAELLCTTTCKVFTAFELSHGKVMCVGGAVNPLAGVAPTSTLLK
jgi:hypothetical protein